jgi:hypothetical protein
MSGASSGHTNFDVYGIAPGIVVHKKSTEARVLVAGTNKADGLTGREGRWANKVGRSGQVIFTLLMPLFYLTVTK